ncbi:hypothetical protein H206_05297 [Candidatus Electrothrix aarhusensis]|uniref:Uncharacterized protein n=1 Tax=Candidatus Electrothrix aarhusensis TaxID=1859131 RepID=A0A444J531_9BACT|nr:hypothetical protein H206_05297 [Candidatus Electrothrix aarhusensis]
MDLWGALVVLLKKTGRWGESGYAELGRAVNKRCWLGHLFLETDMSDDTYRYLSAVDRDKGGETEFAWRDSWISQLIIFTFTRPPSSGTGLSAATSRIRTAG